jgi:hypothetical protein
MSVTRKVLDLAAHETSAVVHARLHSLADDVAELERERDRYRAQVERVEAPCAACEARLMVPTDVARRILSGELAVYHSAVGHRVLSSLEHQRPIQEDKK